jgi:hypothetical protein
MVRLRIGVVDDLGWPSLGRRGAGERDTDDVKADPVRAARVGDDPDVHRPAGDPEDLSGPLKIVGRDPRPAPEQHALAERPGHGPQDQRQLARPCLHPPGRAAGANPVLYDDAHHPRDDSPARRRPPYGDPGADGRDHRPGDEAGRSGGDVETGRGSCDGQDAADFVAPAPEQAREARPRDRPVGHVEGIENVARRHVPRRRHGYLLPALSSTVTGPGMIVRR